MPIIEVDHVTKEFRLGQLTSLGQMFRNGLARLQGKPPTVRAPFKALDDVSFTVEQGEVLGIIGHNGAGKSTLLKLLAGISRPTRGKVSVRGRVAPLIEVGAGLVPDMTGRENIFLNATILGMKRDEIKRKFDEIVAFAELEEFIDTPVKRYSSGMQVRLGFSIATAVESEILIVDEVLAVGDLAFQRKCFDRMEDLIKRHGNTVLIVSHNIRQVERMCGRGILLDHGRVRLDADATRVCNEFYANSDKAIQANLAAAAVGRGRSESTDDIELIDIKILDASGRETTTFAPMADLQFRMTFRVDQPINRPVFGLGFHTTDFVYLATNQSLGEIDRDVLDPGEYCVRFSVRRLPFLPGTYSIRIGVARGDFFHALLYRENAAHILIEAPSANRAVVSNPGEGFVSVDGRWLLEEAPSAKETPDSRIVDPDERIKESAAQ